MSIFDKRDNYLPFEYPEVQGLIDVIDQTYWVPSEVKWDNTVQEFKTMLDPYKQEVFKRTTLSISQVEVAVKAFWGELHHHLPKPEFNNLGASFANNERAHSDTYAKSLQILGLEEEFVKLLEEPAFKRKYEMITESMSKDSKTFVERLLFFTLVIENSSLFSQFAIALSFYRFDGAMKNLANLIGYSAQDENVHSQAGIMILNMMQKEGINIFPFDVKKSVEDYISVEKEMLDWIFQGEDLVFKNPAGKVTAVLNTEILLSYIKDRLNIALTSIGHDKVFEVNEEHVKSMKWFEEEVHSNALDDFFAKKVVDYTKHDKTVTADDLF